MSLDAIFKAYDVRGLYPDELDDELARRIGNAFAHFTGAQQLIVGRGARPALVTAVTVGAAVAVVVGVTAIG